MKPEQGYYTGDEDVVGNILLRYYREQKNAQVRFGQYFVNQYMSPNTVWPSLFYEKVTAKAINTIAAYLSATYEENHYA